MKFKKLLLSLGVVAALISGGCSNQKKQAEPVLTKTQVIKKAQRSFKSGQAKQLVNLKSDTSRQVVASTYTFGGNPTIFHVNYQTENKNKTRSSDQWVSNTGTLYINGQSTWYKTKLEPVTGHSYADLLEAILNNEMLMNPPKALTNAYKMTRKGNTYTLKATIKDKKIMKHAVKPIFATNTQSLEQKKIYKQLSNVAKYQNMSVKLVVKNNKLYLFNYSVNMKIDKLMTFNVSQSYGNMGSQDFLKLPNNALNAEPLQRNKKKANNNQTN